MSLNPTYKGGVHQPAHRLLLLLLASATLVSLPLIAGFFGSAHPAFDSFAHFRLHLALALFAISLLLVLTRGSRLTGAAGVAFALAAAATTGALPFGRGLGPYGEQEPRAEGRAVYRLMHMNLRFDNPETGKVLSLVGRYRPDVITFNEVSTSWRERLKPLDAAYPYRIVCNLPGHGGGVAILSLRPFAEGSTTACIDGGTFAIAQIDFGGREAAVATLHLHWPWPFDQTAQVAGLQPVLRALPENTLLAGDFNATPWSATVRTAAASGGLTTVGPFGPTWIYRRLPSGLLFAGLPIDQMLAKGGIAIHSARTLEPAGSDHVALLAEFSIHAPTTPEREEPTTTTAMLP